MTLKNYQTLIENGFVKYLKDVKVDQKLHFKTCNGGTLVIKTKNYALWVLVGDNENVVSLASIGHKDCVVGKSIEEKDKAFS